MVEFDLPDSTVHLKAKQHGLPKGNNPLLKQNKIYGGNLTANQLK